MKRLLTVIVLLVTALAVGQGTALAHDTLVSTDPADGARMPVAPQEVRLNFNEPVRSGYDTVTVVGPGGTYWTDAPPRIVDSTVIEPVHELGPAGDYVVSYRVLSNDGHPVEGRITFNLTRPGTGTPVPAPNGSITAASRANAGGMPIWPWLVGAVVLVAVGLLLALRLGRASAKR